MFEGVETQFGGAYDPFAEEFGGTTEANYIHIRVQQRNGRKSVTTVQGIEGPVDDDPDKGKKDDKGEKGGKGDKGEKGGKGDKGKDKGDKGKDKGDKGKKSKKEEDLGQKLLRKFRKEFCCNGNIVEHEEYGRIIQLQGDQRKNVADVLTASGIDPDLIKIHGF